MIAAIPTQPLVVATVSTQADLSRLDQDDLESACDCLEFRLDSLIANGLLPEAEAAILRGHAPAIITVRHPAEGGDGALPDAERGLLYERFLPVAWAIDLEIRSLESLGEIAGAAKVGKPFLIASFHDFEKLPGCEFLRAQIDRAVEAGADIVKIAARIAKQDEIFALTGLLESEKRVPLSVMGMGGVLGKTSRLLAAQCGSVLNYGFLTEANAPGQWPAQVLKQLIADAPES